MHSDQKQQMDVMLSSETNEWYTPPYIIEAVREVLGRIDVDPCSDPIGLCNTWIKATTTFDITNDGLSNPWYGNVFVNPPYGKVLWNGSRWVYPEEPAPGEKKKHGHRSSQELWYTYFHNEYDEGRTKAGIFLARAVVGERWFRNAWEGSTAVALLKDLVRFINFKGVYVGKAKVGTALFYLGPRPVKFQNVFEELAWVYRN